MKDTSNAIQEKESETSQKTVLPGSDIYSDNEAFYVQADVPGLTHENVNIQVENHQLTIEAERNDHAESDLKTIYGKQPFSHYRRIFQLPDGIDEENIEAQLNSGVLLLKIPRLKPRKISVKVNN